MLCHARHAWRDIVEVEVLILILLVIALHVEDFVLMELMKNVVLKELNWKSKQRICSNMVQQVISFFKF